MSAAAQAGSGRFIALDGIDGVGKSTLIERLAERLRSDGRDVLAVRDPGSTEVGARLRAILLDSEIKLHRRTEALLFMASRCEMVETVIRPALEAGQIVISDRFLLANVVYQSVDGGVDPALLWQLGRLANGGLRPDLTVLLDLPAVEAVRRLDRPADRMERRGTDYLESVRAAFRRELPEAGAAYVVVDAGQSLEAVSNDVATAAERVLG